MVRFSSLLVVFLMSGCSYSFNPVFPSMPTIEEKNFMWEDIRYNNTNVHVFTEDEFIEVKEALVTRRLHNNSCAKIVNNYLKEK